MAERVLPDVKSRLTVDDRDLQRVATNAEQMAAKVEASFTAAGAASGELSAELAGVDKTLASTAQQGTVASGSLTRLDEALTATTASADRAAVATGENIAVTERAAAAYGTTAQSADVLNASLGATAVSADRAIVGLEGADTALTQVATAASEAATAEGALNVAMGEGTGIAAANTAAQGANAAAAASAGETINNASTAAGALASTETKASRAAREAAVAHDTFATRLGNASKEMGGLGVAGEQAAAKLGTVDRIIGTGGTLPLGMTATIAGLAAVYLGFRQIKTGIDDYLGLADAVRLYNRVTGESVDQSARQLQAMQRLGVDTDTATGVMVKFSKAIDTTPQKLEQLGVSIAHTADGNVNVTQTLYNAIDAYNRTGDAVDRDSLMLTAFGKNGRALLPVLAAGTQGLKDLEAQAKVTFTQADLDRAHELEMRTRDLGYQFDSFRENLAQKVVPALDKVFEAANENAYVNKRLEETHTALSEALDRTGVGSKQLEDKFRAEFRATEAARQKNDQFTQSLKEEAQQAEATAKDMDELATAQEGEADASLSVQQAQLALTRSTDSVVQAQAELNDAIKGYGPKSQQAHDATLNLKDAELSNVDSARRLAQAQVDLADKQAAAGGSALSAKAKHDLLSADLQAIANQLAPNSPLRVQLQQYINQLNSIPAERRTVLVTSHIDTGGGGAGTQRQEGGDVVPGRVYRVGESQEEALVLYPGGGGHVIPTGPPRGQQAPTKVIHNEFHQVMADAGDIMREYAWLAKTE